MNRTVPLITLYLSACAATTGLGPDAGLSDGAEDAAMAGPDASAADASFGTSGRQTLRWKRYAAVEAELSRALVLTPSEVCTEIGRRPCATSGPVLLTEILEANGVADPEALCRGLQGSSACHDGPILPLETPKGVHVLSLGGNEPFLGETFVPLSAPGLTSVLALERVVLTACGERVAQDRRGPQRVFTHIDLGAAALRPGAAGVEAEIISLYQRLLARDPRPDEVEAIASILAGEPPLSGAEFAQLACFSIGTTTEFTYQ